MILFPLGSNLMEHQQITEYNFEVSLGDGMGGSGGCMTSSFLDLVISCNGRTTEPNNQIQAGPINFHFLKSGVLVVLLAKLSVFFGRNSNFVNKQGNRFFTSSYYGFRLRVHLKFASLRSFMLNVLKFVQLHTKNQILL